MASVGTVKRLSQFILRAWRRACLAAGVGLIAIALCWSIYTTLWLRHTAEADGTVIELVAYHEDGDTLYAPVFQYKTAEGIQHTIEADVRSNPASHKVGDKVVVLYSTSNVEDAKIDSFEQLWFFPVTFAGVGVVALIVGIIFQARHNKKRTPTDSNNIQPTPQVI